MFEETLNCSILRTSLAQLRYGSECTNSLFHTNCCAFSRTLIPVTVSSISSATLVSRVRCTWRRFRSSRASVPILPHSVFHPEEWLPAKNCGDSKRLAYLNIFTKFPAFSAPTSLRLSLFWVQYILPPHYYQRIYATWLARKSIALRNFCAAETGSFVLFRSPFGKMNPVTTDLQ